MDLIPAGRLAANADCGQFSKKRFRRTTKPRVRVSLTLLIREDQKMSNALRWLLVCLCFFTTAATSTASPVNLLINGSFEGFGSGSLFGWSPAGPGWFVTSGAGFGPTAGAQDGDYYAGNGQRPETVTLSQNFNTPGATLTFSGYFASEQNINSLQILFDANVLLSKAIYSTGGAWEFFTFAVTGSGLDTITIQLQSDNFLGLDNFVVTEAVQTPIPASLPLFASALAGFGWIIRRGRRDTAKDKMQRTARISPKSRIDTAACVLGGTMEKYGRGFVAAAFVAAGLAIGAASSANAFTLNNTNGGDGFVNGICCPVGFQLVGGDNGVSSATTYLDVAATNMELTYNWAYHTDDLPGYDPAGFIINNVFFFLADSDSSGSRILTVLAGQNYGFYVFTGDGSFGRGSIAITDLTAVAAVPIPAALPLFAGGLAGLGWLAGRRRKRAG